MPFEEDGKEILESCNGIVEPSCVALEGTAEMKLARISSADFEDSLWADEGTVRLDECSEDSIRPIVLATDSDPGLEGCGVAIQYKQRRPAN